MYLVKKRSTYSRISVSESSGSVETRNIIGDSHRLGPPFVTLQSATFGRPCDHPFHLTFSNALRYCFKRNLEMSQLDHQVSGFSSFEWSTSSCTVCAGLVPIQVARLAIIAKNSEMYRISLNMCRTAAASRWQVRIQ